jgi:hypothetical protein
MEEWKWRYYGKLSRQPQGSLSTFRRKSL